MPDQFSRPPLAFLSYAHRDDEQTSGNITKLREALQLAVSSVVGQDFEIFQDRDAIAWGKQWQGRLDEALAQAQFLIPIITPSYFNSDPCRDELDKFVDLERQAGRRDLILPIYFRTIIDFNTSQDKLVQLISQRQYRDWREVRNKRLDEPQIREKIDELADELGESIAGLSAIRQTPPPFGDRTWRHDPPPPHLQPGFDVGQLGELRARVDKLEEERAAREATITALRSARTTLQEELAEARRGSPSSTHRSPVGIPDNPARRKTPAARAGILAVVSALAMGLVIGGAGVWVLPRRDGGAPPAGELDDQKATIARLGTRITAVSRENEGLRRQLAEARKILDTLEPDVASPTVLLLRDCTECPEMILVPAGEFMMGSPTDEADRNHNEEPPHKVTIAAPFWAATREVTFAEWDACVAAEACRQKLDNSWGREQRPVVAVSWRDANDYVTWLSQKTTKAYRLLSEAEWEYVARAHTTSAYWWGSEIGRGNANCDGCGSEWDNKQTAPAASFPANDFGLFDTAGNVLEWVEDCWNEGYEGAPADGGAWTSGDCKGRVLRGGAWDGSPDSLRSAARSWYTASIQFNNVGFRVARQIR